MTDELKNGSANENLQPIHCTNRKSSATIWIIVSILLALMLLFSIFLNGVGFIALISCSTSSKITNNKNESYISGDKNSTNKIAQITINGTIMDSGNNSLRKNIIMRVTSDLEKASEDPNVKAVLLVINSPGGGVAATDLIWHELDKFITKSKKPVVAYCPQLTASGGYYLASRCSYIIASEAAMIGSIGVIAELPDFQGLMGKIGVRMNVFTSKTWENKKSFKDIGSPFRNMSPAEREIFQNLVTQMWNRFVDVVANGRSKQLTKAQVKKLADGKIYLARAALARKLIDQIGYKDAAISKALKLANITDAKLIEYKYTSAFFDELFSDCMQQKSLLPDSKMMVESTTPTFWYLWTIR